MGASGAWRGDSGTITASQKHGAWVSAEQMFCVSLRLLESREPSHDLVEAGGRGSIEAGGVSGPEEVGGVGRAARSGNFASRLDRREAAGTVGRHVFLATLGDGTCGWFSAAE